ncbi:MAG: agmatinase [Rhodospirillaceae bacterium]|nr:MAG: agmatinase [Rhodospirillaceae bacterium]
MRVFQPQSTFMNVPAATDLRQSQAVIVGLPFDCGAHPVRIGSRLGPTAIRQESLSLERGDEWSDIDSFKLLNVVDAGNADLRPGDIDASFPAIKAAIMAIAETGAVSISLGGDGAVALPEMRALHAVHKDLVTLHLDSHTDAYPGEGYDNGNPFLRAVEEKVIDAGSSYHIGMRGNASWPGVFKLARDLGYTVIPQRELLSTGIETIFDTVREKLRGRPVYLCWDMDFFDPSCAPGVCTPTPAGVSAREGLHILEQCHGLNIVGISVNTVSPPHDPAGVTALLAANVVMNFINLLGRAKANSRT